MIAPSPAIWPNPADRAESGKRLKRPNCPLCGRGLLLAEHSRFDIAGRIDHFWACDNCGTEFRTSIALTYQAVA